jgi:hypothetical protein
LAIHVWLDIGDMEGDSCGDVFIESAAVLVPFFCFEQFSWVTRSLPMGYEAGCYKFMWIRGDATLFPGMEIANMPVKDMPVHEEIDEETEEELQKRFHLNCSEMLTNELDDDELDDDEQLEDGVNELDGELYDDELYDDEQLEDGVSASCYCGCLLLVSNTSLFSSFLPRSHE